MAGRSIVLAGICCAFLAGISVTAATASTRDATPDPSTLTLQDTDFPGAQSAGTRLGAAGPVVGGYERAIKLATPYGASGYTLVLSIAFLTTDAAAGADFYRVLGHNFSQKSQRLSLVKDFLKSGGIKVKPKSVSLIKPRALGVSDSSMEIGFVVKSGTKRFNMSVTVLRLDRVVDTDIAIGSGSSVAVSDGVALTQLAAGHIATALVPVPVAPPTISGTVAQGQTLTSTTGVWESPPASFRYQWERCDSAGMTCTNVPGATGVTYVVTPADAGATLRVTVTGTSRFGSAMTQSAATAVIT
jgi:hypothetical protein